MVSVDDVIECSLHIIFGLVFWKSQHRHASGSGWKPVLRVSRICVISRNHHLRVHILETEERWSISSCYEEKEFLSLLVGKRRKMCPELLDIGLVGRIPVIGGVVLKVLNVDLIEATRNEQLNLIWEEHMHQLRFYNFLHSVHKSFGLHAVLLVENIVCVEHNILHLVIVRHRDL